MHIAIVFGTRPEIIKLSSIVMSLEKPLLIHTGQHYTNELSQLLFSELNLPQPDINLGIGSHQHDKQIALMTDSVAKFLTSQNCDAIMVQGDTNSAVAGAYASELLNLPVIHIEAGLRSYDMTMPEERNRIIIDHRSKWLFAPTDIAASNLASEGITNAIVCGNTVIDSLVRCLPLAKLAKSKFCGNVIVTIHRQSNTDSQAKIQSIIDAISAAIGDLVAIIPLHPRVNHNIRWPNNIKHIAPVGYIEFISLLMTAPLIISDSGGVIEEACFLHVPTITMRDNTERPEAIDIGASILSSITNLADNVKMMLSRDRTWLCPYGCGTASKIICEVLNA